MNSKEYYNPPDEWQYESVRKRYISIANCLNVKETIKTDFEETNNRSAPNDLSKLKNLLWALSDGIKKNDNACIEIAIQFVIAPVYFHYSGFIRATMARRLKSVELTTGQLQKLRLGLYSLFKNHQYGSELREFINLLRKVGLGEQADIFSEFKGNYIGNKLFTNT